MTGYVERWHIPGIVTLVGRGHEIHVDPIGQKTVGGAVPIQRTPSSGSCIAKPITAAATLISVDDSKLGVDDSIERWLPELANRKVLNPIDSSFDDTVPAVRAITVRDLLTSCFGSGSIMARPGTYFIQQLIRDHQLGGDGPPHPSLTRR